MRRGPLVVVGVLSIPLLAAAVWLVAGRDPAEAGSASDFSKSDNANLVEYVQGGAALNLRLVALEALRKKTGSREDLDDIARGKNAVMAVYAAGALGKQKTSDSKKALKDLVTDTKLGAEVRKGAMSALAVHWKDSDDLAWLKDKTGSDAALKGHYTWVKTYVYGK